MVQMLPILMLFIFINCVIKLSFWKGWQATLFGLVCGLFMVIIYPYAAMQLKPQLAGFPNHFTMVPEIAVIVIVESVISLSFCIVALRRLSGNNQKWKLPVLFWYPGILIFAAILYFLTLMVQSLPETKFTPIVYGPAAAAAIAFPGVSRLICYFYPAPGLRLEAHFLITLFIGITGLIIAVNGSIPHTALYSSIDVESIIFTFLLFCGALLLIILLGKLRYSFRHMVIKKQPIL